MNILIVEDEELYASKVEMQIDKLGHECVAVVDNHTDAMAIVDQNIIDLILMDINITGDYDGVELAQDINSTRDIPVLYITSNEDDLSFNRATRSGAAGFLVKPFSDIQLRRAIELVLKQRSDRVKQDEKESLSEISEGVLFVKKKDEIRKVDISDIYYLEADGRYARIYTQQDMYLVRRSMKELLERLPSDLFMQCHRSYVVNLSKVKSINVAEDVLILEERTVPLSRREKEKLIDRLDYI